jgi:hypothetical protein
MTNHTYPVRLILASVDLLGKTTATTAATMVGTHEVLETTTATASSTATTTTTPLYTCHWDENGQWICYGEGS